LHQWMAIPVGSCSISMSNMSNHKWVSSNLFR